MTMSPAPAAPSGLKYWTRHAWLRDPLETSLTRSSSFLFRLSIAVAYALIFAPVFVVIIISFFSAEIISFPPDALTLRWYVNAWSKPEFSQGFVYSIEIAFLSTLIGVPIGTAAAMAIVRGRLWFKTATSHALLGPLAIPGIVLGAALYICLIKAENKIDHDLVGGLGALVAAHVLLTIPWTVRLIAASLQGLDRAPEEAAASLGARPWTAFRRVMLPALRPGILAASLFGFIASFENLEISLLLVGPSRTTLPVAMLSYLEYRMDPTLAAVATVQIVIIVVLMLVTDRFVTLSRVV
ncbi:ABC transporter permease [Mesorhizobium sp. M0510]|uniref:ABC transporter permease n=1 Tax=Mesorhizobium sp. M0510 TaxID=2956954 RepID=UPI003334B337